jgi:alpha/beta superfamily hydrolase
MPTLCAPDALIIESARFAAGPYRLEGELVYGDTALPLGAALLAGPHPLLGGNMHNNVMRGLGDGLARHGLVTLRFNYRGVGASEGPVVDVAASLSQFWHTSRTRDGAGYQEDLGAAVAFLRSVVGPDMPLALIGYSFGCTLLPAAAGPGTALVLVAPTVGTHDYTEYDGVENPKLVIAPEGDFAADPAALARWFDGLPAPKDLVRPRLDSHFFRGQEHWLLATVGNFLNGEWR